MLEARDPVVALREFDETQRTALFECADSATKDLLHLRSAQAIQAKMDRKVLEALERAGAERGLTPDLWPVARLIVAIRGGEKSDSTRPVMRQPGFEFPPMSVWLTQQLNAVASSHPQLLFASAAFVDPSSKAVALLEALMVRHIAPDLSMLEPLTAQLLLTVVTPQTKRFAGQTLVATLDPHLAYMLQRLQEIAGASPDLLADLQDRPSVAALAWAAASGGSDGWQAREMLGKLAEKAGSAIALADGDEPMLAHYVGALAQRMRCDSSAFTDFEAMFKLAERLDGASTDSAVRTVGEAALAAFDEAAEATATTGHKDILRLCGLGPGGAFDFLGAVWSRLEEHGSLSATWVDRLHAILSRCNGAAEAQARLRELRMRHALETAPIVSSACATPPSRRKSKTL